MRSAARMATGIQDAEVRRSVRCATAIARIMKKPNNDIQKKVIRHIANGATKCKRAQKGIIQVVRDTGTAGVIAGWRKPASVNAKSARENCVAVADAMTRRRAEAHSHIKESVELHQAIRRVHGTAILPRKVLCGDHLGQLINRATIESWPRTPLGPV